MTSPPPDLSASTPVFLVLPRVGSADARLYATLAAVPGSVVGVSRLWVRSF